MSNTLHYPGDCTDVDPDQLLGPDIYGARYRIVDAEFDGQRTTMQLRPIAPAELAQFIDERREDTFARIDDRLRVAEIFGGAP